MRQGGDLDLRESVAADGRSGRCCGSQRSGEVARAVLGARIRRGARPPAQNRPIRQLQAAGGPSNDRDAGGPDKFPQCFAARPLPVECGHPDRAQVRTGARLDANLWRALATRGAATKTKIALDSGDHMRRALASPSDPVPMDRQCVQRLWRPTRGLPKRRHEGGELIWRTWPINGFRRVGGRRSRP